MCQRHRRLVGVTKRQAQRQERHFATTGGSVVVRYSHGDVSERGGQL